MLGAFARPVQHLPPPSPRQTLAWMSRFIRDGQQDYRIRELVEAQIIDKVFPHDYLSEYAAILNWVRTHIRYVRDPRTIEQVRTPDVTLETKTGDCDDQSVLIGTMVGLVGGPVRLVAGGFGGGRPVLSHVWTEAYDPVSKSWVVLDPVPGRRVHKMLGNVSRRMTMEVLS